MTQSENDARRTRWLWIAVVWFAGGLFDASQNVLIMRNEGRHHSWWPLFVTELALWLPWALATPFISRLARRYPFARGTVLRTAALHLVIFVVLAMITEAWSAALQVEFNPWGNRKPPQFATTWSTSLLYQSLTFLIVYALILTITLILDSHERMARELVASAQLNEALSKAQLNALRRQIEPHFMFNTLHAIAGLIRDRRNEAAVSMIAGLSEFLRRAADDAQPAEVPLAQEVEYLQRYVDIQQVRFGDRLRVAVDIPADLMRAKVPHLLLQPLVENAIQHGISRRANGGTVRVSGTKDGGTLRLVVYNDEPEGSVDGPTSGTGIGLVNLRTRLRILHRARAALELQRSAGSGVEIVVTLPFEEA
jgi:two-component system LytT family sensor kinase